MNDMSGNHLCIDTLNLRLPTGLEGRANGIVLQVATHLSKLPVTQAGTFASITVPTIRLHGGEADGVIAHRIAQSIQAQINGSVATQNTPGGATHAD